MNRIIIGSLAFSVMLIMINSCNQKSEELVEQRRVLIKYTNGKTFCDGFHLIDKMGNEKNRVGIWRFYYPTGALENILQYNKNGDLINEKDYSEDGTLTYSESVNGNMTNSITYYDNGKIRSESILKKIDKATDENDYEKTYETVKGYYNNGQLWSEQHYEDGDLQGAENDWDTAGNLVLTVKYNKGLILEK